MTDEELQAALWQMLREMHEGHLRSTEARIAFDPAAELRQREIVALTARIERIERHLGLD